MRAPAQHPPLWSRFGRALARLAALLAVGLISAKLLRLEAMPDISFPGMQIVVPYPGSTPEEMEELVVRPVEEALATLSGIEEIRASAQSDQATFTVLFDWDRDADAAAFELVLEDAGGRLVVEPGDDHGLDADAPLAEVVDELSFAGSSSTAYSALSPGR